MPTPSHALISCVVCVFAAPASGGDEPPPRAGEQRKEAAVNVAFSQRRRARGDATTACGDVPSQVHGWVGSVFPNSPPRYPQRRRKTLPQLRNGVKAAAARLERLECAQRGIPTLSQEAPMVNRLVHVRDAQFKMIEALRAQAAASRPRPAFIDALHPDKQYSSTSRRGKKFRRVRRIPNQLMGVVVDLMVPTYSFAHTQPHRTYPPSRTTNAHHCRWTTLFPRRKSRRCCVHVGLRSCLTLKRIRLGPARRTLIFDSAYHGLRGSSAVGS